MTAENGNLQRPLLSNGVSEGQEDLNNNGESSGPVSSDIEPISSPRDFFREFEAECKKLWILAGPAIFTGLCRYTLGAITQAFAGHLGDLELAVVSIENSVIAGFSIGVAVTI
ncbi:hypothetical protein Syun_024194 [Stephania yunnanensis]|uniref:Uncharacterized protein n=1 Tax=Stephania yunnanensis TaxID=152371 RepID=A0AAP0FJM1_9MAGN